MSGASVVAGAFSEGSRSGADRGRGRPELFKIDDIETCEKAGIDSYVPRPQRGPSVRAGLFRKDEFSYHPTGISCPAGQRLHPHSSSLMRGLKKINYPNNQVCRDCPIRSKNIASVKQLTYRSDLVKIT
jgi:hypothetical protein